MDLTKVVSEPQRRTTEGMIINLWFSAAYYVKSKMLRERAEYFFKSYGHAINISSVEYHEPHGCMNIRYMSGREERYTDEFDKNRRALTVDEGIFLANEALTRLWGHLNEIRYQKSRGLMH